MNRFSNLNVDQKALNKTSSACCEGSDCCDSSDASCCDTNVDNNLPLPKSIVIDGKQVSVSSNDKNLVDVAKRNKIAIPAPCYLNGRKNGCCKACVVEIAGEQKYACCTRPVEGMAVTINRSDLKEIRKQRLKEYSRQ